MNTILRRFTIRQRLLGSLLALCVLILAMGGWSALSFQRLQQHVGDMLDTQAATSRDTGAVLAALERVQRLEQSVMLNGNNANEAADHQAQWKKTVAATREQFKALTADPERAAALNPGIAGFEAHVKALGDILQQVVDAKMDATAAYAYAGQAQADLDQAREVFAKRIEQTHAQIAATRETDREDETTQARLRMAVMLAVLVAMSLLMLALARSIVRPLSQATALAGSIAQGDLTAPIERAGQDEIADFMRALGDMQQALRNVVGQVRDSADSIRVASDEVATGNLDLSQRTEQAASNLEETAASMETLTGTVRHSADAALQASQLASSASAVAQRGGEMVEQVVQTMAQINASSRKIADITGVIDGIAFQTNILALNAAVEAARAGEQGRGFAVVATEVRSLAQRSANAAKEIKALIGASVDRVENGARQVQDAGSTMGEIVASVQRVSSIINEISGAASDQSRGIGEVGTAVNQLDQMTQQNAALVEESAAAAESLKQQARQLADVVATFRLS